MRLHIHLVTSEKCQNGNMFYIRDAPLDFKGGGGAGSFCKKKKTKNMTHSKVKKKNFLISFYSAVIYHESAIFYIM